ncbi:PREDICTED: transcription factor kayak-like [Rhagoletis zephyria]|uniref:transcription factor kayak-like n=1 Tax=Rhagoletis zephyria TaxID=28612 RepID=UPI00081192DC|nr:PREDICTED: transcription factor kayak-like [Rhagoletis zephyria]
MHALEREQQKPHMQKPNQKEASVRKSTPTCQEQQFDTIQLSSDEEQAGTATATHEQRNRSRTRSRSHSHGSSNSSSSLSSTLSSSYRSLDYEAEADEEDANECEGLELQRKLAGGNDNLMHVQNFLNCFDTPQQRRIQQKATTKPEEQQQQQQMLRQQDEIPHRDEINRSEQSACVDLCATNELAEHNDKIDAIGITTAAAEATVTEEMPTTSSAVVATKALNKPCKFTISTKFLRKPRHKLKSVNIAPTADVSNALVTTTSKGSEEILEMQELREKLQQQKGEHISQQQHEQRQQQRQQHLPAQVDEPNVKFNSNFSINSLLNKR